MRITRMLAAACLAAAVTPAQVFVVDKQDPKPEKAAKVEQQKHQERAARIRARLTAVIDKLEAGKLSHAEAKEQLLALAKRLEQADAKDRPPVPTSASGDVLREYRSMPDGERKKIAELRASGDKKVVVMDEDGNVLRADVVELHGDGDGDGDEAKVLRRRVVELRERSDQVRARHDALLERVRGSRARGQGQGEGESKADEVHEKHNKLQQRAEALRRHLDEFEVKIENLTDLRVDLEDVRRAAQDARRKADARRLEIEEVHEHAREAHRKALEAHREAAEAREGDAPEARRLRLEWNTVLEDDAKVRAEHEKAKNDFERAHVYLRRAEEAREQGAEREKQGGVTWHVEGDGVHGEEHVGVIRRLVREHADDGDAREGIVLRYLNRADGEQADPRVLKLLRGDANEVHEHDGDVRAMIEDLRKEMREVRAMMKEIREHVRSRGRTNDSRATGSRAPGFRGRVRAVQADGEAPSRDVYLLRRAAAREEQHDAPRDR